MNEQERSRRSDENYRRMRTQLDKLLNADKQLQQIAEKIRAGTADFRDTAEYSEIVAKHLSEVLQDNVGEIRSPLGKQYACEALLKDHYAAINDVLGEVQTTVDEKNGIHIAPQKAPFPTERVQRVAHALEDPTVPHETIVRRAGASVENVAKSMHDDYIKKNAEFRSDAGLRCYIVRTTDGKCCAWCGAKAGRYVYGEEPQDVYRRHDNCGCTVIYESGRTRQDVWTKKTWEVKDTSKKPTELIRLDYKQAKEMERKNLKYRGLTSGANNGIMKENIIIGRSLGAAGKNYPVKLPDGNHTKFAEGTEITKVKVFAGNGTDTPIRNAIFLENEYGIPADKWQKVRGECIIVEKRVKRKAEIHWYEAEGHIVKIKVKRYLDES